MVPGNDSHSAHKSLIEWHIFKGKKFFTNKYTNVFSG
jgi:hypothetical protein